MSVETIAAEFLGAFLGFALALLAEAIIRKASERKEAKSTMAALRDELTRNRDIAKTLRSDKVYVAPYETGAWRAAIATGAIGSARGAKGLDQMLAAYIAIEEASLAERRAFELSLGERDGLSRQAREAIEASRRRVLERLDECLG